MSARLAPWRTWAWDKRSVKILGRGRGGGGGYALLGESWLLLKGRAWRGTSAGLICDGVLLLFVFSEGGWVLTSYDLRPPGSSNIL